MSPLVPFRALAHPNASSSQSKHLSQLQNRHGSLLRLRLRFLSFFKGALLPNFNTIVDSRLLTEGFPQLEDVFSILHQNLPIYLDILGRTEKDVSAGRR